MFPWPKAVTRMLTHSLLSSFPFLPPFPTSLLVSPEITSEQKHLPWNLLPQSLLSQDPTLRDPSMEEWTAVARVEGNGHWVGGNHGCQLPLVKRWGLFHFLAPNLSTAS